MNGLYIAGALALVAAAGIALFARLGRTGWEPVAAALLIGIAGYAWQGDPALPGKPVAANEGRGIRFDEAMADRRRSMGERVSPATKWLVMSDGLARAGKTQDAANVLVAAVRDDPKDPNLWVGLGNALVLHGEGVLSPAADHAYRRALALAPDAPSPRFFYGLALAQSGQLQPARAMWADLVTSLREGTPFRAELENNIAAIDRMLAAQSGGNQ
ncbi:MAG: tetratricopeptide repeat protein [Sphingobium sp.]